MSAGFTTAVNAAKSALQACATEMSVIGNNVANVNNASYHRQTVSLSANAPTLSDTAYLGSGVSVSGIVRQYDLALETSLRLTTTQFGYDEAYANQLSQLEDLLLPDGDNVLDDAIQEFANALQDVATTPESITSRESLLGSAEALAEQFNMEYANLNEIECYLAENTTEGTGAISERIAELNSLAEKVADLNERVKLLEQNAFNGQKANDLRDERDAVIMEMAELADISFTETEDYRYTITLGDVEMVSNPKDGVSQVNEIEFTNQTLTWGQNGEAVDLTNGTIKGLIDARQYVVDRKTELDDFAKDFADIINASHRTGTWPAGSGEAYDLDGNVVTGDFFDASTEGEMTVVITDARKIGASSSSLETGNGDNAINIWTALDSAQSAPPCRVLNGDSILNYTDRYSRTLAVDVSAANNQLEMSETSKTMFQDAVFDASGVNMDEEMANMLQIQRTYQAAAKFLSVVDGMLETIIEMA